MSTENQQPSLPLQKVLDLGMLDKWLRGMALIVPQSTLVQAPAPRDKTSADFRAAALYALLEPDFNTHAFVYGTTTGVTISDIEKMVGFRQLLAACSKGNVRVDVMAESGTLQVSFDPSESFSSSLIFGARYTNILPALFGVRKQLS